MKYPYIATSAMAMVLIDGKQYTITNTSPNFQTVKMLLEGVDHTGIPALMDIGVAIAAVPDFSIGKVESKGDVILYCGHAIHNSLSSRIMQLHKAGEPIERMVAFLGNLMSNPSSTAVSELYDFLEYGDSPLTDDGYFLAYKNVRNDFLDIYSGTIDNSVGETVSMPRNSVDDNRDSTCSHGLHFCSKDYLPSYRSADNGRTVIVKIHPANVVAIPADYNYTKGRCCEYEVIAELNDTHADTVFNQGVVDTSKIKLTVRQTIAVKTVDKCLKENGYVAGIAYTDLNELYEGDRLMYEDVIEALKFAFDVPITRDRAVKHFKFVKSNM